MTIAQKKAVSSPDLRTAFGTEVQERRDSDPVRPRAAAMVSVSGDPPIASEPGTRRRLLVVHPSRHYSDVISTILMPLRLDCDFADGEAAFVSRIGQPLALIVIVVDPSQPDTLEMMKISRRKQPWVPVLVLLTSPDAAVAEEAMKLGAMAIGSYTCPPAELRAAVTSILSGARPRISLSTTWRVRGDRPARGESVPHGSKVTNRRKKGQKRPLGNETGCLIPEHRSGAKIGPLKQDLEVYERLLILRALEAMAWNRMETARVLKINRVTLYQRMKRYRLF